MSLAAAVGLAKNLVYAGVLGVEELAYYGIVLLVLQFGVYVSNWGILNGLNYELPVAYGRGDRDPDTAAERALGALLATSGATALIYLLGVLALEGPGDSRLALSLAALLVLATTVGEFFILMLRVRRQLVPLSIGSLVRALALLVGGALAGAAFGFVGVVLAETAALLAVTVLLRTLWLPGLRPRRPARAETIELMRVGLPLTISNVLVAGIFTLDRIFVAVSLPTDDFGQYTFASIVVVAAFAASGILSQLVAPQVLYEHGAGLALRDLRLRMLRITAAIAALSVIGFGVLVGLTELASHGVFEEYSAGLDTMRILYLGGVLAVLNIYGVALWAARRFMLVMWVTAVGVLVALAGGLVLVAGDPTIEDFAWLFVAAQATSTIGMAIATEIVFRRAGHA